MWELKEELIDAAAYDYEAVPVAMKANQKAGLIRELESMNQFDYEAFMTKLESENEN